VAQWVVRSQAVHLRLVAPRLASSAQPEPVELWWERPQLGPR
jgi:hypothetical protein